MAKKFLTDIDIAGGIYDSSGDIGNSGQVLSSTGSGLNWIDSTASSSVIYQDAFSGNGSATAFTLANSVDNENKTQVYIDGVYQFKNTYSISGTTLTFSTAPPNNTDIEVISFNSITGDGDILTDSEFGSAGLMTTNGSGAYSITTNNSSNWNTAYTYSQVGHLPLSGGGITGAITTNSTFDGRDVATDGAKLDGIEASADVTDTTNVTAAGALMDSELADLAGVKAVTISDLATETYVDTAVSNLVDSSPATLNTLNELAEALGDDPNFATTTANSIGTKLPLTGGTMTGALTIADSGASDNPLILGSSSQTSYTLQQWQTSSHGVNEAYIIAYGAGHGSQAGNFAMKNIESGGNIFFELAAGVEPLRLTSTNATFAGNVISKDTFYLENAGGKRWQQLFDGNNWNLRYYNGSSWSADALSIDTSNNATFAGRVSVGGASNPTAGAKLHVADGTGAGLEVIPSTGNDKVTLLSYDRNASAYQSLNFEALDFSFLNGNATFAGIVRAEDRFDLYDGTSVFQLRNTSGAFDIRNGNTGVIPLAIDSSSNATFAGNIDVNGTASDIAFVGGSMNFKDSNDYIRITKTSASAQLGLFRASDGGFYIGGSSSGFRIYTSSFAEKFKLESNGNATFAGTGSFQGGGNTLTLKKGTGTAALAFAGTATDPEATALIEGVAGGGLKIYTSNGGTIGTPGWSPKLTIAAGGNATFVGNVTIGNTTSVQPLTVAGNVLFRTTTVDGFENRFQFIAGGSGDGGQFYVYNDTETPRVRINSAGDSYFIGGNLGVGESSPSQKLNVREDGGSDVFRGIEVHNNNTSLARAGIAFQCYDWVQSAIWHGRSTTAAYGGALVLGTNPNTSDLTVGGVTGRMWILNNGNVGIGEAVPTSKLSIKGAQAAIDITRGTAGDSKWEFSSDSTAMYISEMSTGTRDHIMTLKETTGNVGIGENAPAAKLQVSGTRNGNSEYVAILGEDGGANGAANSGNTTPVHKTLLTGYGIPYSGQTNARLTTVGFLEFDSTPGWTGNQRNWALTNGYDMGGTNGPKFAILMGDTQNADPQLGTNGAVGTGDGANTRVAAYWKNTGDMVVPEGGLFVKGLITGDTNNANRAVNYLRTITVPYTGNSGSFTFDIDPVAEFGTRVSGGRMKLEVSGWQTRMNAGYIVYRNDGSGLGKIGVGNVTYFRYIWSETSGSQAMVSVSLPSSSTNVIRISFSGWHGNDHGFEARLTATS